MAILLPEVASSLSGEGPPPGVGVGKVWLAAGTEGLREKPVHRDEQDNDQDDTHSQNVIVAVIQLMLLEGYHVFVLCHLSFFSLA